MKNSKKLVNITINNIRYDCVIPKSSKEGLSLYNKLELQDKCMLFSFPSKEVNITTKDMKFPITVVVVDNYKVKNIINLPPNNILETEGRYALEFSSKPPNINIGDKVDLNPDKVKVRVANYFNNGGLINQVNTFLLDDEGNVQMIMEGKERIFSRIDTNKIMKFLDKKPNIKNMIELGKIVATIVETHSKQKQEYVEE